MDSVNIKINIDDFTKDIAERFDLIRDNEVMLRPVCFDLIDLMTKRIHEDGKDSNEAQIGTYSEGYMKVRTGDFANSKRVTKGKNKGKLKDSGTFTDRTIRLNKKTGVFTGEDKVGKARPNYNRTSDTKVVASLTRQLEGDWTVIPTEAGYGVGFQNEINFNKTQWLEATYKKKIFDLSPSELEYAVESFNQITSDILNGTDR